MESVSGAVLVEQPRAKARFWTYGLAGVGVLGALALAAVLFFPRGESVDDLTLYTVKQGPLDIKVLEGGSIEALDSLELKSEIKGYQGTKILSIVDEGYTVTQEDVHNELVLVELDSSELQDKLTTAEISFKGTQASFTEAEQQYEIQLNQSESDIYEAELEVKFALMELKKFLGAEATQHVLDQIAAFEKVFVAEIESGEGESGEEDSSGSSGGETDAAHIEALLSQQRHPKIDFSVLAEPELLGDGEANQTLRTLEDDLIVAKRDLGQAETYLEGTRRLHEKNFVTREELVTDEMDVEKKTISVEAAETAKQLFILYEFPKEAETKTSDYIQARRKLERTRKKAISELANARAKLSAAEARERIESEQIAEFREQIEKCVIKATKPGLVVYGGDSNRYWNEEPIKEGSTVRERQTLITIPNSASMAVKVDIHESDIKKVEKGQRAVMRVDAFPGRKLAGEVTKVSVLPDSENRWMNPDLKVYETTVKIEGDHDWLKPGMSAQVEILIDKLDDVLYVPIQSVVPQGDAKVCYVLTHGEPETRPVETGQITVEFIEITNGLEAGDRVLLLPPEGSREDETNGEPGDEDENPIEEAPLSETVPVENPA